MRTAAKLGKSREILLCALLGLLVVGLLERYPSLAPFNRTWLEQNFPFSPWLLNLVAGGVVAWFVYSRRLLHALALWLVSRSTEPGFLYLPQPNSRRKRFLDHAPWVGREDEVNELKRFLDASEPFQWWWITGEGGIGKSRLALELLQIAKRRQFDAGFWLGDVQILDEWRPRRRTLIVLDDAGQVAPGSQLLRCIELIRKLIDQHQSRALPHPVRLLLIERDRPLELEGPGATERSDWEFCFRREPLHLQKLPSKAVEALISAVARQWKKDPPQGNARERVLRLGTDNPFWLLLALHSYFEHGKVDWTTKEDLLFERVTTIQQHWRRHAGFQPECESILALAALTQGLDLKALQDCDAQLWKDAYERHHAFYRRINALTDSEHKLNCPMHDILKEYFVLKYAEDFDRGVLQTSLSSDTLRDRALHIDLEKTTFFLARLSIDFPNHMTLARLMPRLNVEVDDAINVAAWTRIRGHIIRSEEPTTDQKELNLEEVKKLILNPRCPAHETVQQALAWTIATSTGWYASELQNAKKKRTKIDRVKAANHLITSTRYVRAIYDRYRDNVSIATSASFTYIAGLWQARILKTEAASFIAGGLSLLQELSEKHAHLNPAYARGLIVAIISKVGDASSHLRALEELAESDPAFRDTYIDGLIGAIHSRFGDTDGHLKRLAELAADDPVLRPKYGKGLVAALHSKTGSPVDHINALRHLAEQEPAVGQHYAAGLIQIITLKVTDPLSHLNALHDLAKMNALFKESYAKGLAVAVRSKVGDGAQNLHTLCSLTSREPTLTHYYAEALISAIHSRVGEVTQHISTLRGLAAQDPTLKQSYASGLVEAIQTGTGNPLPHLDTLHNLTNEDIALRPKYAAGLIVAIGKGTQNANRHVGALKDLAAHNPELLSDYAKGLLLSVRPGEVDSEGSLHALRDLSLRYPVLKSEYVHGLVNAIHSGVGNTEQHLQVLSEIAKENSAFRESYLRGLRISMREFHTGSQLGQMDKRLDTLWAVIAESAHGEGRGEFVTALRLAVRHAVAAKDHKRIQTYLSRLEELYSERKSPAEIEIRKALADAIGNSLFAYDLQVHFNTVNKAIARLVELWMLNQEDTELLKLVLSGLRRALALCKEVNHSNGLEQFLAQLKQIAPGADDATIIATSISELCNFRVKQADAELVFTDLSILKDLAGANLGNEIVHEAWAKALHNVMGTSETFVTQHTEDELRQHLTTISMRFPHNSVIKKCVERKECAGQDMIV